MYLAGRTAYLSGPIEHDIAEDWRTPVKKVLTERFNINVFDPSMDEKQNKVPLLKKLREEERWDELAEIAHEFVMADLGVVDRADFLIACLPHKTPVFGTVHEIIAASTQAKKPTLLVCPQGKKGFSSWAFGIIRKEFLFGSWNELYNYLQEVDDGKHKDHRRWYFTYHYFQEGRKWAYRK